MVYNTLRLSSHLRKSKSHRNIKVTERSPEGQTPWSQAAWVRGAALPLASCVTLCKSRNLSVVSFLTCEIRTIRAPSSSDCIISTKPVCLDEGLAWSAGRPPLQAPGRPQPVLQAFSARRRHPGSDNTWAAPCLELRSEAWSSDNGVFVLTAQSCLFSVKLDNKKQC